MIAGAPSGALFFKLQRRAAPGDALLLTADPSRLDDLLYLFYNV